MDATNNFIDLTVNHGPSGGAYSDDEDEAAFGIDHRLFRFYKHKIWKLKNNDPNFCLLQLSNCELLTDEVWSRIGVYLWSSKHMKNLSLVNCDLTDSKMKNLFGKIAQQNETNDYLLKNDVLGKLGVNESTLVGSIVESLTSFQHLLNVNISRNNVGTDGLDVLVKSLAGCPIENHEIISCGLEGILPLKGLRKCMRLKTLDISGNSS